MGFLRSHKLKLAVGIAIGGLFLYLAFRQVQLNEVAEAIKKANYWYLLPATAFLFLSLWLRAYRWGIFFRPIKPMKMNNLFSALMVGYMANNLFPFKLGELLRAYSIGKLENFSKVASLATVVVERILDVILLLILLAFALVFQPFTGLDYIKPGGLLIFVVASAVILFLVFLVIRTDSTLSFYDKIAQILPEKLRLFGRSTLNSLMGGLVVLKKPEYYLVITVTSFAIWLTYIAIIVLFIFAFNVQGDIMNGGADKIFIASATALVMSGISVSIPSSPGYVGTYHYLVTQAFVFYGVQASEAFSLTVVMHLFSMAPPALLGIYYFLKQHISLQDALEKERLLETNES